ncbi:MAG: flagellar biosynthetic protein FliO [Halorhodospira sp.]
MPLRARKGAKVVWRKRLYGVAGGVSGALLAAPAWAETAPAGIEGEIVPRVLVALLLVLALIVGLAWLLRRYSPGAAVGGPMRVLASVPVGQRERIVLVQVGEVQLLLGVAPGRVQTLHVFEAPVTAADAEAGGGQSGPPFAARLRRLMQQSDQQ